MNKKEQRKFVRSLVKNVQSGILSTSKEWPPEWDGLELRQLVSDHFAMAVMWSTWNRKRKREYNNEVIVRNLV